MMSQEPRHKYRVIARGKDTGVWEITDRAAEVMRGYGYVLILDSMKERMLRQLGLGPRFALSAALLMVRTLKKEVDSESGRGEAGQQLRPPCEEMLDAPRVRGRLKVPVRALQAPAGLPGGGS